MTEDEEKEAHHAEPKGHMSWWEIGGRRVSKTEEERQKELDKPKVKGVGA